MSTAGYNRTILFKLMQVTKERFDRVICWRCKRRIRMKKNIKEKWHRFATIDHITPILYGGCDDWTNWQLLCNLCNSSKHTEKKDYRDGILMGLMEKYFKK